jgi:hypothetical protein
MKSCCGRKRAALTEGAARPEPAEQISYRYFGLRPLIIRGGASGRLYRFTPGAIQPVSAADTASLAGIPGLAAYKKPLF